MVYYVTIKPYTIDLGPIEMPLTYNEITNIFTDSDLLPKINATYYRNFKQTIKNINNNISNIESNYVKNTDFATAEKAGVLRVGGGITMSSYGVAQPAVDSYENYKTRGNSLFISKGTLENVLAQKFADLKAELTTTTTDESEETE